MVTFPIYVADPLDPLSLFIVESLEDAEGGELELVDVADGSFAMWDARGVKLDAKVEQTGDHWLKLTATGIEDQGGLWEAITAYAEAVGVPDERVKELAPTEAIRYIEEVQNRADRQRRRWRGWWKLWGRRDGQRRH